MEERRTEAVSNSEQSASQQQAASHSPAVASHSQMVASVSEAGSPSRSLPQQSLGSPGSWSVLRWYAAGDSHTYGASES